MRAFGSVNALRIIALVKKPNLANQITLCMSKALQSGGSSQRCTESDIFDSDSDPASAEYTSTPLRLRHILKF